jgi:hypothetical protein
MTLSRKNVGHLCTLIHSPLLEVMYTKFLFTMYGPYTHRITIPLLKNLICCDVPFKHGPFISSDAGAQMACLLYMYTTLEFISQ